jgi:DNA ligase 1
MKSDWLYQETKLGKINQWRVWTEGNKIFTQYGQMEGKLQTTVGTPCIATNVGRSNERNPIQQAEFEAEAMIKNQLRLKYSRTIGEAQETRIQPMLADNGKKAKILFPVYVQRKYDGLRCMRVQKDGNNIMMSRGNKVYDVKHISEELKVMFPEEIMTDGELYVHGVSLQTINSWVKRQQPNTLKIEYHIYDIPGTETWERRLQYLKSIKSNGGKVKIVETFVANSFQEIEKLHDQFILEGYEGAIIRLPNGLYEFGKRSKSLLKWKNFEDKEFKIVGIKAGTGKMVECPIFACKNDINEEIFDVVPLGTMEERKLLFDNSNIGKMMTVKFIGRTDLGLPKFAVGKVIRSEEDIPVEEQKTKKVIQKSLFD